MPTEDVRGKMAFPTETNQGGWKKLTGRVDERNVSLGAARLGAFTGFIKKGLGKVGWGGGLGPTQVKIVSEKATLLELYWVALGVFSKYTGKRATFSFGDLKKKEGERENAVVRGERSGRTHKNHWENGI